MFFMAWVAISFRTALACPLPKNREIRSGKEKQENNVQQQVHIFQSPIPHFPHPGNRNLVFENLIKACLPRAATRCIDFSFPFPVSSKKYAANIWYTIAERNI